MEFNRSNEDAEFHDELRAFAAENYPPEMRVPNLQADLTKEQPLLWHASSLVPHLGGCRTANRREVTGFLDDGSKQALKVA